jgi:hypothetical protein
MKEVSLYLEKYVVQILASSNEIIHLTMGISVYVLP